MDREYLFTQDGNYLEARRRQLFLLIGLIPVLSFSVFMTWSGGRSAQWLGITPSDVVLVIPGVLGFQLLVLVANRNLRYQATLRLSPETLSLAVGGSISRLALSGLQHMKVSRGTDREVQRLRLRFAGRTLRLEGFLEMDTLRGLIIQYAGTSREHPLLVKDVNRT